MSKNIKIGLMGSLVNNGNLGCCALTYGTLSLLEKISKTNNVEFTYMIFERNSSEVKNKELAQKLGIDESKIIGVELPHFLRPYKIRDNYQGIKKIKNCDLFINLTQGDSFSDIYGIKHFLICWIDAWMATLLKKPLIMGPQTYGPFQTKLGFKLAKILLNNSIAIFTRDTLSQQYLLKYMNINSILTSDIAFNMPYNSRKRQVDYSKKVGINVSGLLWSDKKEGTPTKFTLKSNYDSLIVQTIKYLLEQKYDIYMIPHVASDIPICQKLVKTYNLNIKICNNPIEVKEAISEMDLFIGARMHSAIAAYDTNVPLIPMAYSRKFSGLFNDLDYNVLVDLQTNSTEKNIIEIKKYIDNLEELKSKLKNSKEILETKNLTLEKSMEQIIIQN